MPLTARPAILNVKLELSIYLARLWTPILVNVLLNIQALCVGIVKHANSNGVGIVQLKTKGVNPHEVHDPEQQVDLYIIKFVPGACFAEARDVVINRTIPAVDRGARRRWQRA